MLREAEYELNQVQKNDGVVTSKETRSTVARAEFIPKPPHWGPKLVKSMPLDAVFQHLAINELYRLSWAQRTPTALPGKN
ncbi:MAG TPA: hypothetical protein PLI60_09355, partial [Anaerolineaceae bacterium]|nr:hypothetical protein [Anaerolineaceae bacterium]